MNNLAKWCVTIGAVAGLVYLIVHMPGWHAAFERSSIKLAVVKERLPPTRYPPMPAYSTLEIKSLEDQDITVTDVLVNNKLECIGLLMATLPQKLGTGDAIKVLPKCDPVKVVVSTDRGEQVYTWSE
jgi:hypothetical protein